MVACGMKHSWPSSSSMSIMIACLACLRTFSPNECLTSAEMPAIAVAEIIGVAGPAACGSERRSPSAK